MPSSLSSWSTHSSMQLPQGLQESMMPKYVFSSLMEEEVDAAPLPGAEVSEEEERPQQLHCCFFLQGKCSFPKCCWSHDESALVVSCRYGARCRCGHHGLNVPAAVLRSSVQSGGVRELGIADFLGTWQCSHSGTIEVQWAPRPVPGRPFQVTLTQTGPRRCQEAIDLCLRWNGPQDITCGHYKLDMGASSPSRLQWNDTGKQGWIQYWSRGEGERRAPGMSQPSIPNSGEENLQTLLVRLLREAGGSVLVCQLGDKVKEDCGRTFAELWKEAGSQSRKLELFLEQRPQIFQLEKPASGANSVKLALGPPPGLELPQERERFLKQELKQQAFSTKDPSLDVYPGGEPNEDFSPGGSTASPRCSASSVSGHSDAEGCLTELGSHSEPLGTVLPEVWRISRKKLSSGDKSMVSTSISDPSCPGLDFILVALPNETSSSKGGGSFKKAKGLGFLQLKLRSGSASGPARVTLGLGASVVVTREHDFSDSAVCLMSMPDGQPFDFYQALDPRSDEVPIKLTVQLQDRQPRA